MFDGGKEELLAAIKESFHDVVPPQSELLLQVGGHRPTYGS